ncbi:MAG: DUF896 domain-containing protein [Clostridiales Family XIII bacterium]|jgi:uncharacterized protein YnzC (UPF0291/DUF896 family)|nr:DUF896 domain-containing protein [Clostridiales Family XIII bacterium]
MLEKRKMERINELARKQKSEGLSEAEQAEQRELRQEYLKKFRSVFKSQLDTIEFVDANTDDDAGSGKPH